MATHYINLNNYVLDKSKRIGRGSSGVVYLGHNCKTKEKVAIKRLDISQMADKMSRIWNEIQIMKGMDHPNIIQLYDIYIDLENNYLYLIMEYCDGSDLSDYTKTYNLDLNEIHKIMTQIKDGLYYLRSNDVMHRDLKPQNILLHQGSVKLADFGLSVIIEGESQLLNTMCGSPLYMSPEIIEHQKYTAKSDLWSVGVILYQLIYHKHPYNHCTNLQDLTKKVKNQAITYPDFPPVDPLTMDLLHGLLNKNCHNRMTWDEFFEHQWFNNQISITANSFSPPNNAFFRMSFEQRYQEKIVHDENKNRINNSDSISSDEDNSTSSDVFFSLSGDSEAEFPKNTINIPIDSPKIVIFDHQTPFSSVSESSSMGGVLSLTDYLINDYQKKDPKDRSRVRSFHNKNKPIRSRAKSQPLYGTSAPSRSHNIDYSPSNLNFSSVGSSLIKYANKSFSWFKSSLDY
jgi:serine/threonine protein kinase